MRSAQIDVVNTHSSADSWCSGIAARLLGKKVVRTRHLSTPIRKGLNSRILYNRLADRVVTTCEAAVAPIREQARLSQERCCSIPTGVDPSELQVSKVQAQRWREARGISPDTWLIGTVCVLRTWKGIFDLLRAAHMLRHESKIRWVVVGSGINEPEFLAEHQALGLEQQVLFTGTIEPPFEAMAAMDTFCLLSTGHEGVSQALLQAAYLGKPLLATDVGGSPEVCLHHQTGLLVPPVSPADVAQAASWMAHHPHEARAMGEAAHELVAKRFTRQIMADQMEQIFLHA
jgi:glycosyltransferase involved in cell wall biosynthesis